LIIQDNIATWRTNYKSAQEVKLFAIFQALLQISAPFNLYSDSQYITRALKTIEIVPFIGILNSTIQTLFRDIQHLICSRVNKCYFSHIRAHSGLPRPLARGNALADEATRMIFPSLQQMAKTSHSLHHQNSHSLRLQFGITREAARQIVKQCQTCPQFF
jgi:ribonuclease HI